MSPRRRDIVPPHSNHDDLDENSARKASLPDGDNAFNSRQADRAKIQFDVAIYVESISAELRKMAREVDLESLAYFLEMARIEASSQIERGAPSS